MTRSYSNPCGHTSEHCPRNLAIALRVLNDIAVQYREGKVGSGDGVGAGATNVGECGSLLRRNLSILNIRRQYSSGTLRFKWGMTVAAPRCYVTRLGNIALSSTAAWAVVRGNVEVRR